MIVLDTEKPNGKVFIEKEMRKVEEISQAVTDTGGLCKGKEKEIIVQKTSLYYEDLVEVGFGIKLPPPPKPFRERKYYYYKGICQQFQGYQKLSLNFEIKAGLTISICSQL